MYIDNVYIDNVKNADELNTVLDFVYSIFPQIKDGKYSYDFWKQ